MYSSYNIHFTPQKNDELPAIDSSPMISTPYLDASIDTPYLDNNSTSPFLETVPDFSPYLMYASLGSVQPFIINNNNNRSKNDVCVARYLDGCENKIIAKLTHDPIAFNGDPTVLLLDKSKSPMKKPSPTIKLETVTEENSDSLFPPLTSSQVSASSYNAPEPEQQEKQEDIDDKSWEDMFGFEANSSPLSTEETDFDIAEEEQNSEEKDETYKEQPVSKKRKATASASETATKSKKRKNTKTTAKKTKEQKLFECPLCDHVSKRRYNLSTHIKTHDKLRVKEFDCDQCSKSFDRRHDRDRHLATVHRGEKSFACDHCTTHFTRRDALEKHLVQKHEYDQSDFDE
jgi:uncharacterized C2H2 Zn-finger protein